MIIPKNELVFFIATIVFTILVSSFVAIGLNERVSVSSVESRSSVEVLGSSFWSELPDEPIKVELKLVK